MTTVTVSKRTWLASQTGPDGKPLAKVGPGVRGRFSHAAQAALAKAEAEGIVFADSPEVKAKVSLAKPVNLHKSEAKADRKVSTIQRQEKAAQASSETPEYDAKAVRAWAAQVGIQVGVRGRIPAGVIADYLAQNGGEKKAAPTPAVMPQRKRVRPENEAWVFFRRKAGEPDYITEPLTAIQRCYACNEGIGYCACKGGPRGAKYMGGAKFAGGEIAMLTKPVA